MVRRLMVLPFDRTFTEQEKDPDLFEDIWANELPGVLNQALRGYQRLLERGTKFKRPKDVRQATTAIGCSRRTPFRRSSRPIALPRPKAAA